ncbi:MAG: hypothetical protein GY722_23985, partial [bacterium]|nr:hypothetical protein [bacterium]
AATPRRHVEVRTFVDLAPRYASWQVSRGLPRPPRGISRGAGQIPDVVQAVARGPRPRDLAPVEEPRIQITAPEADLRVLRDPETPAARATLALRATVDPPVEQVLWIVDGEPFQVADYPYAARWPLAPGKHTFQVRLPFRDAASRVVRVTVY